MDDQLVLDRRVASETSPMVAARTDTIIVSAQRPHRLYGDLGELFAYRDVLNELLKRDLRVRYKRSVLGHAWTMLNPLIMMGATTIVYSHLFRFAVENYPIYMLSAYL